MHRVHVHALGVRCINQVRAHRDSSACTVLNLKGQESEPGSREARQLTKVSNNLSLDPEPVRS